MGNYRQRGKKAHPRGGAAKANLYQLICYGRFARLSHDGIDYKLAPFRPPIGNRHFHQQENHP
jgi:hypothetical protein